MLPPGDKLRNRGRLRPPSENPQLSTSQHSYLSSARISDKCCRSSYLLTLLQNQVQLSFIFHLVYDLFPAFFQPIYEGHCILWLLLSSVPTILECSEYRMGALGGYFPQAHFEIHPHDENELHLITLLHLKLILSLQNTNDDLYSLL